MSTRWPDHAGAKGISGAAGRGRWCQGSRKTWRQNCRNSQGAMPALAPVLRLSQFERETRAGKSRRHHRDDVRCCLPVPFRQYHSTD
jgi:hypothetical protein